jgi:hypothetical protein
MSLLSGLDPRARIGLLTSGAWLLTPVHCSSTHQQKLLSGSDDGRWTVDDGAIVYGLSSIVTRTSNEYPQGCTSANNL